MASNADALAPPLHRLIVFADIAGFSAPQRTVADQIAVRAEFFEMMRAAFAESGVPWANCHIEDRGDGALILVPPEAGSEFMVMVLPQLLAGMLHRRNRHLQPSRRIQVRLAVHMGAVQVDGAGCVGSSIVHAARMLDASPLKRALAESAAPLALIVPESFFHGVVEDAPGLNPAAYQRVEVAVREFRTVAWIRLFDPFHGPAEGDARERRAADLEDPADARNFDAFYLAHYQYVRNVLNARAQDWTLAEDVADEAMAIAYRKWDDLVEHPNPVGFVVVTARRILSRIQRQRARRALHESSLPSDASPGRELHASGGDPADVVVNRAALRQALQALSADQRECFVLHEILGHSIRHIAELLGIPEGTVKSRLHAARRALRTMLEDDSAEGGA